MKKIIALTFGAVLAASPSLAQFSSNPGTRPHGGNDVTVGTATSAVGQVPMFAAQGHAIPGAGMLGGLAINTLGSSITAYTIQISDLGKEVDATSSSAVTLTLPKASSPGFTAFFGVRLCNRSTNTSTSVTVGGSGSNVGASASAYLRPGLCLDVISNGTNWTIPATQGFIHGGGNADDSISLQPADGTAGNGNARGGNAIDFQLYRTSATQVASGGNSIAIGKGVTASGTQAIAIGDGSTASSNCVAIGVSNTCSNTYSFSTGNASTASGEGSFAAGESTTASGQDSLAFGANAQANSIYGVAMGHYASTNANSGMWVFNGNMLSFGVYNSAAHVECIFVSNTSGSSSVTLTTDGVSASSSNVCAFPNFQAMAYQAECVITDLTGANKGKTNTYTFGESVATRVAGAIALGSNPTAVAGPTGPVGSLTLQAVPAIAADTSHQGFAITYQPPSGNTDSLNAVCRLYGTMTAIQ
jgi:hypothetical protein